jgi:exodeoxyribonuclease V alpha subunit
MESVAIAAPTGKAAQRLSESIANGLASTSRDIADVGLRALAPAPQTLHRLLGWSPSSARFARHENDPLPYRVVIVDEASMIDLAMMDRLLRALSADARLVLFGDADQLPSIEAGAVFRDMCASLGAVRLTANLRVAGDAGARRIVGAAEAVISGAIDARFAAAVTTRASVDEVVRGSRATGRRLACTWKARF